MRDVKTASTDFINQNRILKHKFQWQEGYGGFSINYFHKYRIINYIMKQDEHHKKIKFRDEYLRLLKDYNIDYKSEYLFDFFDL